MASLARSVPPATGRLVTARFIQQALGAFWILDGALQLQPFMFGVQTAGASDSALAVSFRDLSDLYR
jgi:hypothetical protein